MVKVNHNWKIGDKVEVIRNLSKHRFKIGEEVTIFRIIKTQEDWEPVYDACNVNGDCCHISQADLIDNKNTRTMKMMKDVVETTAKRLLKASNRVTTLEIKTEVRKTHPHFNWIQTTDGPVTGISEYMIELASEGKFNFTFNGTHRIYSLPTTQTSAPVSTPVKKVGTKRSRVPRINRNDAYNLMRDNKGHFFTATFTKKDGSQRTINCQYMKDQSSTGTNYVKVRETGKLKTGVNAIRQINLHTLSELRIGGQNYIVK